MGPQFSMMKKLENDSGGAKFKIKKLTVIITGSEEAVTKGKQLVEELLQVQLYTSKGSKIRVCFNFMTHIMPPSLCLHSRRTHCSHGMQNDADSKKTVVVAQELLGQLIGPKGSNVKALQQEFGVQVDIPRAGGGGGGPAGSVTVEISGSDGASVAGCCARIVEIVEEAALRKVELPAEKRQVLVHNQQALLKALQASVVARCNMSSDKNAAVVSASLTSC